MALREAVPAGVNARVGRAKRTIDRRIAKTAADMITRAMKIIRDATPGSGAYSNEADYFEPDWQRSFWGVNYARLLAIKKKVDPDNLFRVHHGIGSET